MEQPAPQKTIIATEILDVRLIELTPDDAGAYYDLISRNRDHLTQYGDYAPMKQATLESITRSLNDPPGAHRRFGIWLRDTLVGRVDVSPRLPGHFVIGYWLGSEYTGKGYATLACKALIQYARDHLGATDIFAGVTKGNAASEAVLGRLGFRPIADKGMYTRFRLRLPRP